LCFDLATCTVTSMNNTTNITITNVAAMRRLVVGMWTRHVAAMGKVDKTAADSYTEAAHIGLSAIGVPVSAAPFGLTLIVIEAIHAAGPKPSAANVTALPIWREKLTDSIVAKLLE